MSEIALYFGEDGTLFEQRARRNGGCSWLARDFMAMLGYESYDSFKLAINRAIGTCTTLGIPVVENFQQTHTAINDSMVPDYKLSRFACYLIAMNADIAKPAAAAAQAYLARLAEAARQYIEAAQDIERVQIRDDVSGREKSLSSTARRAGVEHYPFFQNEGYRGMYNMNLTDLKAYKGLPDGRSPLDFMGKRELAGNLFRLAETEATLKSEQVSGQRPAERVAREVGRKVRNMMIESDGTAPEDIPAAGDINEVRRGLKQTAKEFTKLDQPRKSKPKQLPPPTA